MSVQVCVALLALLSLTTASDPKCLEMTKTLENRTKLHGKWIMYAQTSDCEDSLMDLKNNTSSWTELVPVPDSEDMILHYGDKRNGVCDVGSSNATYDGNVTKSTFYYDGSYHDHFSRQYETCQDCMMWVDTVAINGRMCTNLHFYSRTGNLTDSQKDFHKKQFECFKISEDIVFGGSDLCPVEKAPATRSYPYYTYEEV